jgi:hypothetical protein
MQTIKQLDRQMDEFFKDIPNVSVTHPEDGAVAIVTVGASNDIIKTVRICAQKRFKGSYGVCFGSCEELPVSVVERVLELNYEGIDGADDYIVGLSEKINKFFKVIKQ